MLKRLASILLLGILAFNWYGYRLLSDYLQHRADARLEAKLDHHSYDDAQLTEIRIPLHLPYLANWTSFERCDGETVINGIHYRYVKRKIEDNQLVLLCLPNNAKTHLQAASNDFFKLVNDLQHNTQGKKSDPSGSGGFKNPVTEYWQQSNDWSVARLLIAYPEQVFNNTYFKTSRYHIIPEQPPENA